MTSGPEQIAASLVAEAEEAADAADARAGIRTRPADPGELDGVLARFESTWGEGRGPDRSMIQALEHAGNTVLVAVEQPLRVEEAAQQPSRDPGRRSRDARWRSLLDLQSD